MQTASESQLGTITLITHKSGINSQAENGKALADFYIVTSTWLFEKPSVAFWRHVCIQCKIFTLCAQYNGSIYMPPP